MGRTRRTKKRSHVTQEAPEGKPAPHTIVMERGRVGRTLGQLVQDLRRVMEPHTASKLKVRQRNVLMDFVNVAGPLGVTHFLMVSRSESHVNLRICRLPRGPTITYHVTAFSLTRDVTSGIRKPVTSLTQYMTAPLLILNNFSSEDKPSKLMATILQSMLPSLNVQTVKLANINRCVLFNYNTEDMTIELRHYNIRAVARGISRAVKRLGKLSVPNLSRYQDISDYMLGGCVSESEGEEVAGEEVTLPQTLHGRGNIKSTQSSVRLTELGPRLTLKLVKIEAGLCKGEVLHHEFIHKTKREARDVRKRVEGRERLRSQRKRQQEENVARKEREKDLHKEKCLKGMGKKKQEDENESGSEEEDDREWYRREVGEEPDPDVLVPGSRKRKGRVARTAPIKRQRTESRGSVGRRGGGEGVRQGRGRGGGGEGVRQGRGRGGGGEGVRQGRGRGGSGEGVRQGRGRGEGVRQGRGRGEKVRVRGKFASKKKGGWSATSGKTRTRKNRNR